jgi:DNA polymerase I-like protein with 3'-5' exonuclease and polymerase domains
LYVAYQLDGTFSFRDPSLLKVHQDDEYVHAVTARALLNGSGDATPEQRGLAKNINFGLSFGLGAKGLQN